MMATHSTSPPPATAVTAEELLRLPDDDRRLELVEGELREMPPAGAEHGSVAFHIAALLQRHIEAHQAGRGFAAETGFLLARNPDTVRAPDAAFVTRERAERVGRVLGYWPGPPDLAVEVVSPGDAYSELHDKALAWLAAGTHVVLVVDPATRRVTVYRSPVDVKVRAGDEAVDCSDVLAGFALPASELFPT
jgi:Uma2 family endonuclease